MWNPFKSDPLKKLESQYAAKLEEGIELQRKGDIRGFAKATEEAEAMLQRLNDLRESANKAASNDPSGS